MVYSQTNWKTIKQGELLGKLFFLNFLLMLSSILLKCVVFFLEGVVVEVAFLFGECL